MSDPITTVLHPDIIQSHILKRLDGQTLASATCASAQLLSLCSEDLLWREICNSTWPATSHPTVRRAIAAFPSGHRSFYSDSFPSVRCHKPAAASETSEFISAVDIYYDDELLYSKVTVTETLSAWFLSSPFRLDLLSNKETVPTPLIYDGACVGLAKERLRVSWILIDPSKKRAVNIASMKAVEVRRHWLTEEVQLRYATVLGDVVQCAVVVSCGGEKEGGELQVREVSMQVEDIGGKILTGLDSLGILGSAMEGQRWKSDMKREQDIYDMFLKMKIECREREQKREKSLDMMCIAAGVSIFVAVLSFFLSVRMKVQVW
ncbi:hypothetical protein ACS0TY_026783 [Phlomoides rotata]